MHTLHRAALLITVLLSTLSVGCSHSKRNAFTDDPTKLSGTWVGASTTLNSRGETGTNKVLTLLVNEQGGITGQASWERTSGAGGHDGERETTGATEALIGSLNRDDGVFFLVETEESGFWYCRTINADLVHGHLVQPGQKHVSSFVTFSRAEDSQ